MELTLIGTGTPVPLASRGGSCLHIRTRNDQLLLDCGPGAVRTMLEEGLDPSEIRSLFISHYHMDHIASFGHFVVGSWILGRRELTVYGPEATENFLDGFYRMYERDVYARRTVGNRDLSGLTDIETETVAADTVVSKADWEVDVLPVDHVSGLETYAYRVSELSTGDSMVFSADTTPVDEMESFATGTDILVHESTLAPFSGERPPAGTPWEDFAPVSSEFQSHLRKIHTTPREAAKIAEASGVGTVVLTHLLPARDIERVVQEAQSVFDGEVLVATDGLTVSTGSEE